MSEPSYVSVNGYTCDRARLTVGYVGPWCAELHLPGAEEISNPVTIRIGPLTLRGAVMPGMSGVYAEQRTLRVVGGAGGWGAPLPRKGYHNDAGVKASEVAQDAARESGETLGVFAPASERVGLDYAREAGLASSCLEAVIGPGVAWWVDYAGVTQVGPRASATLPAGSYQVLAFDPSERTATLQADDPARIVVGATLAEGIDQPSIIRELEVVASGQEPLRVQVWLGGSGQQPGRLAQLLEGIARRALDDRLYGLYRYRIVQRQGDDRLDLQAVDTQLGLPDLRSITIWPGVTATRSLATSSGLVLVAFAEGQRSRPLVVALAPYGTQGFAPADGATAHRAAREGDEVEVTLPTGTLNGSLDGVPITGTITWPNALAIGKINKGSALVYIAGKSEAP